MDRIRVGLVGCGEAAQLMHLPALRKLEDTYAVTALADVSPVVAEGVAARWGVGAVSTDWQEVVERDDVDAVLVTCPNAYHGEVTVAALEAGKHVLVEKPMCLTEREADAIVAARDRAARVVQVGYMRRYAPAFEEACRLVSELDGIRFARVRNILGLNELIGDQTSAVVRATDLPAEVAKRAADDQDALVSEALGEDASELHRHTYFFLNSLNTHDFSAMRDLFGMPRRILYASRRQGAVSPYMTAAFDHGDFICHFEAGFDELPRVEQDLQVYGDHRVINVAYDTGFVRNMPVRLTVTEAVGTTGTTHTTALPSWEDPFVSEWKAFARSVREGAPVKASPEDARLDLDLCRDVARVIAETL